MAKQPIETSPNHKRVIAITLRMVDEFLCECELWARGRELHSVLYREENSLTSEQREQIFHKVESLRSVLMEMQQTLGLKTMIKEPARIIRAACFALWESLIELQGKYIRAYGEPSGELVAYLDPKSEEIITLLQDILKIVESDKPSTKSSA
ncbi:MAG TPA: hypothetical protein PK967_12105 [Candidatus Hydrogenedentes bacterium]|nr:hypothetical protein [Candidatus Hydrogenedentota bacterium]